MHRQSRKQWCCPYDEARDAEQQDPEGSNLQGSLVGATAEVTSPGSSPGTFSAAWPCRILTSRVWAALCTGGEIWDTWNYFGLCQTLSRPDREGFIDQLFPQAERLKFYPRLLHLENLNIAEGVREEAVNHCKPLVSWVLCVSSQGKAPLCHSLLEHPALSSSDTAGVCTIARGHLGDLGACRCLSNVSLSFME